MKNDACSVAVARAQTTQAVSKIDPICSARAWPLCSLTCVTLVMVTNLPMSASCRTPSPAFKFVLAGQALSLRQYIRP